jgi:hypothetical protein
MVSRADAYDGRVDLGSLSRGAEVVACFVEEHVMFSAAAFWRDGLRVWSVEHDAQEGIRHLVVAGELPAEMSAIIKESEAAQDAEDECDSEVDYIFEIPVDIAQRITDFRYDRDDVDGIELKFDVLDHVPGQRRAGWFKSIFGGG